MKKIRILFAVYFVLMLALLFLRGGSHTGINTVPFVSIKSYVGILLHAGSYPGYAGYAVINLFGNILLFIPAGLFLPRLYRAQRHFLVFLLTSVLSITAVETLQYLLRVGSADIDDLILNCLGMALGFMLFRFSRHGRR